MPAGQKTIRVLTVDDHALLRNGIRRLIGAESDMQLVAEASTGREAVEEFRTHRPEPQRTARKLLTDCSPDAVSAIEDHDRLERAVCEL